MDPSDQREPVTVKRLGRPEQLLDWSEQRHHLSGALGTAILTAFEQAQWIARRPGNRAVVLTDLGRHELRTFLGPTSAGGSAPA